MKNADLPAMPGTMLDRDFAKVLQEYRSDLNLSVPEIRHFASIQSGLTKREYFAGMAMQGLIANHGVSYNTEDLAERAVCYADALLENL